MNPVKRLKRRMSKTEKKLFEVLLFLIKFTLLGIPLYLFVQSSVDLYSFELVQANIVSFLLKLSSINTEVHDILSYDSYNIIPLLILENSNSGVGIDSACTGYRSMYAFVALILSVGSIKLKKRITGILIGIPIIFAANIIRIYTTILSGYYFGQEVFNIVHTFLWREGLMMVVLILWGYWLFRSTKKLLLLRHLALPQ